LREDLGDTIITQPRRKCGIRVARIHNLPTASGDTIFPSRPWKEAKTGKRVNHIFVTKDRRLIETRPAQHRKELNFNKTYSSTLQPDTPSLNKKPRWYTTAQEAGWNVVKEGAEKINRKP